jgi:hypothetical protein
MPIFICSGKNNSLTRGLVGSAALAGHRGHCFCDGGAILVGPRGYGDLAQEGPPLVLHASVHPVSV